MNKIKKSPELISKVITDSIEETTKLGTKGYNEIKKAFERGYKQGQNAVI